MKMLSWVMLVLAFLFNASVFAQNTSHLRVAHLSPDAPAVDVWVDGNYVLQNVAFKGISNYLSVDAGKYDLEVRLAGTNTVALELAGVELITGTNYSVFAVGQACNSTLAALPVIDQGTAQVRFGYLSPGAPAVAIWVNSNCVLQDVAFKTISDYLSLSAGEYRIQVSPAGVATPIVIDATVALEANKAYIVAPDALFKVKTN